jgi:hypothetical protein
MLIVDEISFASSSNLLKLNESLHKIKQVQDKYAGLHMIFSQQLLSVGASEWNSIILSTQFCTMV